MNQKEIQNGLNEEFDFQTFDWENGYQCFFCFLNLGKNTDF